MKKILLLLMLCYSFAFSEILTVVDRELYFHEFNNWCLEVTGLKQSGYSGLSAYSIDVFVDRTISINENNYYYNYSSVEVATTICTNYSPPPICDPDTEIDVDGTCEVIGEQGSCVAPNVRLTDGSCSMCSVEQHYDMSKESCINNCVPTFVSNPNPTKWIELNQASSEMCMSFLLDREIDGTWLSADNGCGGQSIGCYGQPDSPCDNVLSPSLQRPAGGYIYKGRVLNSSICSSYVDGSKYIDSRIRHVDDDCAKNDDYYCYLLPLNTDNNETNQDNPLPNPNPDGTVPNDNNISNDLPQNNDNNLSNPQNLNNQILQDLKNNLQDQSLDVKDYHSWFKNKFGKWEPADFKTDMNDTNKILKQIADKPAPSFSANLDTKPITDKLQEIIDKNTSIDFTQLLDDDLGAYDKNGTYGYTLDDSNTTYNTSVIDDFMSTFTTSWDNMQLDIASVSTDGNSLIETLKADRNGGFTLNLPHATVTECPYIATIDFSSIKSGWVLPISIDLCKPFSAVYPVFYILFSIMFTVFIIAFGFKSIMRLV